MKQLDSEEVDDSVEGIFLGEIVNNFPHELSVKFAEIMNTPAAKSTKVVDFFDESQRDLETDLPIRFQRKAERKKKKES